MTLVARRPSSLRLAACALCLGLLAAPTAEARNGGLYVELAPSYGFFMGDEVIVEDGDNGDVGEDFPVAGFMPQLNLGVNLFGYAGAELNVAAHAWDLGVVERGGAGYIGGSFRLTPLELLRWVLPPDPAVFGLPSLLPPGPVSWHDRPFDLGLSIGGGYTIAGEDYAYQGSYLQWSVDLQVFITPNLAIGIDLPFRHMFYEPFRYTNYAESKGLCTDGGDAYGFLPGTSIEVPVDPSPTRFRDLEVDATDIGDVCDGRSPAAWLFAPSLTITGVIDFGI